MDIGEICHMLSNYRSAIEITIASTMLIGSLTLLGFTIYEVNKDNKRDNKSGHDNYNI